MYAVWVLPEEDVLEHVPQIMDMLLAKNTYFSLIFDNRPLVQRRAADHLLKKIEAGETPLNHRSFQYFQTFSAMTAEQLQRLDTRIGASTDHDWIRDYLRVLAANAPASRALLPRVKPHLNSEDVGLRIAAWRAYAALSEDPTAPARAFAAIEADPDVHEPDPFGGISKIHALFSLSGAEDLKKELAMRVLRSLQEGGYQDTDMGGYGGDMYGLALHNLTPHPPADEGADMIRFLLDNVEQSRKIFHSILPELHLLNRGYLQAYPDLRDLILDRWPLAAQAAVREADD